MDDQAPRGQVLKLSETEARRRFPPDCHGFARTAQEGPRGISVNKSTRVRDQEWALIAVGLKRAMRKKSIVGEGAFALTTDVAEAHRQVPIDERDWYLLGCQIRLGSSIPVNKVGTLGAVSESNHWSRIASAIGRLAQYLV